VAKKKPVCVTLYLNLPAPGNGCKLKLALAHITSSVRPLPEIENGFLDDGNAHPDPCHARGARLLVGPAATHSRPFFALRQSPQLFKRC